MAKLICATYGDALFEIAQEENKLDVLYEEAQAVRNSLRDNAELMKFLNYPKIDTATKKKTVEDIYQSFLSKDMVGFLGIIVEKGRHNSIEAILEYFCNRVKEAKGIGVAYVTSAASLTDAQKQKIEERLLVTTDYKSLELEYQVEEDLIGGLVIRIGDRVLDSSIKTKLYELKRNLMGLQLG